MVPEYGETVGGVSATIEYAVVALGVRDIILCGHSDCGAMRGPDESGQRGPYAGGSGVAAWLRYGERARRAVQEASSHLDGDALLNAIIEQNVLAQLDPSRCVGESGHPATALEARTLAWMADPE